MALYAVFIVAISIISFQDGDFVFFIISGLIAFLPIFMIFYCLYQFILSPFCFLLGKPNLKIQNELILFNYKLGSINSYTYKIPFSVNPQLNYENKVYSIVCTANNSEYYRLPLIKTDKVFV